jgi:pyruvate/2-oxoacid:ferredoxin oxidoreductase beta subunit
MPESRSTGGAILTEYRQGRRENGTKWFQIDGKFVSEKSWTAYKYRPERAEEPEPQPQTEQEGKEPYEVEGSYDVYVVEIEVRGTYED